MEKKTLLTFALIGLIFILSNKFLWKKKAPLPAANEVVAAQTLDTSINTKTPIKADDATITPVAATILDIPINNDIVLQNDKLSLRLSNVGGRIVSAQVKDYVLADKTSIVELIPADSGIMGFKIDTGRIKANYEQVVFEYQSGTDANGHAYVKFYTQAADGLELEKKFSIADDYHLNFTFNSRGRDGIIGYDLMVNSGINDTEDFLKMKNQNYKLITQTDEKREDLTLSKLKKSGEAINMRAGRFSWASARSKYFVMGLIPEKRIVATKLRVFAQANSPAFEMGVRFNSAKTDISDSYTIYLGPVIYEEMLKVGRGYEETTELGWKFLRPISRIFVKFFTWMHRFVPNFGICLLIFAFLLKLLLYPVTHKMYESSQKMQQVQPLIKAVQAQYKNDIKKQQEEVRKIHKKHGVNPLGGCLPLLLQMPIFFALYPVLRFSIALRQQEFFGWLTDLSAPDPMMILPILMGLFMFLQQKMSAAATNKRPADEMDDKEKAAASSQKMMMYIMPVMMVFIFRSLPSGLVLYWTFFNVLNMVQQYFILKKINQRNS